MKHAHKLVLDAGVAIPDIEEGMRVQIVGAHKMQKYNNTNGTIVENLHNGRWKVIFDLDGKVAGINEANLMPLDVETKL